MLTTCAYGVLIKEPLLSDYEMLNVHPSLLPRWRGAAPMERAIMAGDAETGVSIMRVDRRLGLRARSTLRATEPIRADDDYGTLAPRLETLGADLLVQVLDEHPAPVEQDEAGVTYAAEDHGPRPRARPHAAAARRRAPRARAAAAHRRPRCRSPTARFLGVVAARVDGPTRAPAGGLLRTEGERLLLDCNGGALELTEVRPPGGRPMAAAEWLRGRPDPRADDFRLDPALPDRALEELLALARAEWATTTTSGTRTSAALVARGEPRRARRGDRAQRGRRSPWRASSRAYVLGQLGGERPAFPRRAGGRAARAGRARARPRVSRRSPARSASSASRAGRTWLLAQRAHPEPRSARGRVRARRPRRARRRWRR